MRSNTLVLLAVSVIPHLATAAVLGHGPFARSGNFIRSFNQSSILAKPVGQRPDSTSDSLAAAASTPATLTPSTEANPPPLTQAASVSSILPSKQVGSVAAVGNGPGAASVESNAITTPTTTSTPATLTPSAEANPPPLTQAASVSSILPSKQVGSVAAVGNGPGAASVESSAITTPTTRPPPSAALPSSTISKPSLAVNSSSSTDGGPSIAATTKQVGSVPAAGNGPGAASIESGATTTPSIRLSVALPSSATSKPSLTTASSSSTTGRSPQSPLTTKTANSSTTSTSFSRLFTLATSVGSETTAPSASETPQGHSSSSLPSAEPSGVLAASSSFSRRFTLATSVGSETAAPSASETPQGQSSSSLPSAEPSGVLAASSSVASVSSPNRSSNRTITDIPTSTDTPGKDDNVKMAEQFNSYFDAMNLNSGCDAALNSEATACINKQLATCGSDRKYILTRCDEGQECRALPLDSGSRGIYIQCITPSDAAAKLGPGQSSSIATPSTTDLESVTQKATVQGSSTTIAQGSVTPSSQTGKSSETSLSTEAASSPAVIIPSETSTFSSGPTTTKIKSSSSSSLAVASPSPSDAGSGSIIPSTTADKSTTTALVVSVPTTLLTSSKPSKNPAPASEASAAPSAQTSASDLPNVSQPGIVIIPEPRKSDVPSAAVHAEAGPVTTSTPFTAGNRITVRETVTVTTTVHDKR